MDKNYLIDTNVIIYYANGLIPPSQLPQISNIFQHSFQISTVSQIEVLGWHKISATESQRLEHFLNKATVFYIDKNTEQVAIRLKQKQKMDTPDAIIAATCLIHSFTLVTRNGRDFWNIKDLKVLNPFI